MDNFEPNKIFEALKVMDSKDVHTSEEVEEAKNVINGVYDYMMPKEKVVVSPELLEAIEILNHDEEYPEEKVEWAEMMIDTSTDGEKIVFDFDTNKWCISSPKSETEVGV